MPNIPWIHRLLGGTRGQIVALLRRSGRTVNELAAALRLTDNAVRPHLTALERDGLVEQRVARGGVGKPAYVYHLTAEADALLPKPYAPVLGLLLTALAERLPRDEVESLLREVGRRAAAGQRVGDGDLPTRLHAAVEVLGALGGDAELEQGEGAAFIRGYSCPLAALVPAHPEACHLAEALLTEVVGAEVREQCEKGDHPRCRFRITLDRRTAA